MTKEEAIAKLKNFAEHAYPNEEFLMAIEALSRSEKPNKWIPVSERVPLPESYKAENEQEEKHD